VIDDAERICAARPIRLSKLGINAREDLRIGGVSV
jgi:hypothetical protein